MGNIYCACATQRLAVLLCIVYIIIIIIFIPCKSLCLSNINGEREKTTTKTAQQQQISSNISKHSFCIMATYSYINSGEFVCMEKS